MEQEKTRIPGTSRQEEEAFLERTLSVIRANLENYGAQVGRMRAEIDEMLEHFHDDNPELINLLENSITMHDHMARALERNEKAKNKPYFGRIVFQDESLHKEESLYIGKGGISEDATHQAVIDWRAPIANAYYENGLGKCAYTAPGDRQMEIDLKLKRTYEIEQGKLLEYFDSEVVANDDLLTKYLARNKQAVLGEIVATIQKEQNEIIRKSPYHNIIVQGVAGSGKTTVAMHRISFILYNYQERFKPDDFYIVGSNRILLNYITGVLPDLDVYGVRQMTMEQLFVRLLYEDWDEKKYGIRKTAQSGDQGSIKGSSGWFHDLEAYCNELEWNSILKDSIYLNPRQFVEGLKDGKSGVYDETAGKKAGPSDFILLVDGEAVKRYIRQNPRVSMQNKINMLNDRLLNKIKEEFLGKGVKYTEAERKAILRAYRGRYGGKEWKGSIYALYQDFLTRQIARGKDVVIPDREFDVYDLAALAYLYKRIKETEVISEAHHIVIDEAQDFGMMAYCSMHFCIEACTYTVMGDVSQNIHFGFGLSDWEELRALLLPNEMDSFGILKKSYRNTVEISEFAIDILHHGKFSSYPVEPIIRHGKPVQIRQCGEEELLRTAAGVCTRWQKEGFDTIAVVCRNRESADRAAKGLGQYTAVMETDLEKAVFGNGIMVLPVEYTKGLEFDAVLILDPTREEYPSDDGHAKLLYVAATRALHELCVLTSGSLTGLIADPVPVKKPSPKLEPVREKTLSPKPHSVQKPSAKPESVREEPLSVSSGKNDIFPKESNPARKKTVKLKSRVSIAGSPMSTAGASSSEHTVRPEGQPESSPSADNDQSGQFGRFRPARSAETDRFGQLPFSYPVENKQHGRQIPSNSAKNSYIDQLSHSCPMKDGRAGQSVNGHIPKSDSANLKSEAPIRPSGSAGSLNASGAGGPGQSRTFKETIAQPAYAFGDIPPTEKLRPAGHARIDLSIRWVTRQPDGLYLQSRYGILRLSPVGSAIVRVSFARNGEPESRVHPGVAVDRTEKCWMYKDSGSMVELSTDEILLQVNKSTGAIRYMTREKKLLLAERARECRQLENRSGGNGGAARRTSTFQSWLFLEYAKDEHLYSFGPENRSGLSLRGTARYISHCAEAKALPFLLSDKGYGILLAAEGPLFSCDLPAYGSYLSAESVAQMDYYFIAGKKQDTILNAYAYLCGKL